MLCCAVLCCAVLKIASAYDFLEKLCILACHLASKNDHTLSLKHIIMYNISWRTNHSQISKRIHVSCLMRVDCVPYTHVDFAVCDGENTTDMHATVQDCECVEHQTTGYTRRAVLLHLICSILHQALDQLTFCGSAGRSYLGVVIDKATKHSFDSFWKRHSFAVFRTSRFMKSASPMLPPDIVELGPEMLELLTSGLPALQGIPARPLNMLLTLLKASVQARL